ncbi:MAG: hypothetical protein ACLUNV_08150 [Sutterella wadsworthensis]
MGEVVSAGAITGLLVLGVPLLWVVGGLMVVLAAVLLWALSGVSPPRAVRLRRARAWSLRPPGDAS